MVELRDLSEQANLSRQPLNREIVMPHNRHDSLLCGITILCVFSQSS